MPSSTILPIYQFWRGDIINVILQRLETKTQFSLHHKKNLVSRNFLGCTAKALKALKQTIHVIIPYLSMAKAMELIFNLLQTKVQKKHGKPAYQLLIYRYTSNPS